MYSSEILLVLIYLLITLLLITYSDISLFRVGFMEAVTVFRELGKSYRVIIRGQICWCPASESVYHSESYGM